MAYIYPAPGTATEVQVWLQTNGTVSGNLVVPALQDITINAATDVFSWTQLDERSKLQVPTTATNDVSMNLVLDKVAFFGANVTAAQGANAASQGVFGLSRNKDLCNVRIFMGSESGNASSNVTMTCQGYVTGLAPATSADSPVFVSPITITVTGDYTVVTNTAPLAA
jgi:hypothetical protein